jgi:hypothetical protein
MNVRKGVAVWDMRKWGPLAAIVAIASLLALAPAASAQNASVSGYKSAGAQTQAQVQPGQVVAAETVTDPTGDDAGVLPFTGLDLLFLAGGGLLLVGAGAGLAKVRPKHTIQ